MIFSAERSYKPGKKGVAVVHIRPDKASSLYPGQRNLIREESVFRRKGGSIMAEVKIGEVVKFFAKPSVAAVKITSGELSVGDKIKFTGHTTDFEDEIESMEINNQKVEKATVGDFIGIKVKDRVRPGDEMFKITPD